MSRHYQHRPLQCTRRLLTPPSANSMQWAGLTVSLAARCGVSRLTVAGWVACSISAWLRVSGQGEPQVAHKACQVCQYCNEREAARWAASVEGRSNLRVGREMLFSDLATVSRHQCFDSCDEPIAVARCSIIESSIVAIFRNILYRHKFRNLEHLNYAFNCKARYVDPPPAVRVSHETSRQTNSTLAPASNLRIGR